MDINKKAREFASVIRSSDEFKLMQKSKMELDKNRSLKKQFDQYVSKKNNLQSKYRINDLPAQLNQLNKDYQPLFDNPIVSNYMNSTRSFNAMMENIYKSIEKELLK